MNDDERTLADRCWRGRTPVEDELFLQLKITNEMSIDQDLCLVHAPGGEVKLAAANIPSNLTWTNTMRAWAAKYSYESGDLG
jgi:hypothetical protein